MDTVQHVLLNFLVKIRQDPNAGAIHVSLYMAIYLKWIENNHKNPIILKGKELMKEAMIGSSVTYYRTLNDLHRGGYIKYYPSYNRMKGSEIFMKLY